jgi:hypothetical protein
MINGCQLRLTCSNLKLKKHFSFFPFHKVYNYLPHSVVLNFKLKDVDSLFSSLDLGPYNSDKNYGFLYHPIEDMEVAICIDGYHCCDFKEWTSFFTIKDYRGNKHSIRW